MERDLELAKLVSELGTDLDVEVTEIEKECCGTTYMVDCTGIRFAVKPEVIELIFLETPRVIVSYAEFTSAEKALEFVKHCRSI